MGLAKIEFCPKSMKNHKYLEMHFHKFLHQEINIIRYLTCSKLRFVFDAMKAGNRRDCLKRSLFAGREVFRWIVYLRRDLFGPTLVVFSARDGFGSDLEVIWGRFGCDLE